MRRYLGLDFDEFVVMFVAGVSLVGSLYWVAKLFVAIVEKLAGIGWDF